MEVVAQAKFVRQTPRKLRLVADEIRGLEATEAEIILKSLNKKAARLLLKTLRQGMANAENNFDLKREDMIKIPVFNSKLFYNCIQFL